MNDQNVNGEDNGQYMVGSPDDDNLQPDDQSPEQDQFDYDEMDLTPYEEDDDATLHKKLCAAKVARKRAEEDLKLLCNRIGLLKMEEGKVSWQSHPFSLSFSSYRWSKKSMRPAKGRTRSCRSASGTS